MSASGPAVDLRGVTVRIRGMPVLEEIDLRVERGELLGVIGPNGAGKTMLLKLLLGLVTADRGTVRVLGSVPRRARGRIGYVPQQFEFDRRFPIRVLDVVAMGRLGMRRRLGAADRQRAHEALERVTLDDLAMRQIGQLSGGQLQRVMIARALAMDAGLLLLDEPTSNLDSTSSHDVYELVGALAGTMAVILVDHDVGVLSRHVQNVACLNRRLHYHGAGEPDHEVLERAYGYPVEVLRHGHGHGHRLLDPHERSS